MIASSQIRLRHFIIHVFDKANIGLNITRIITIKHTFCFTAALVILWLFCITSSFAQGLAGSSWPMYGGNPAHTGRYDGPVTHTDGTVKWKINIDVWGRSSPAKVKPGRLSLLIRHLLRLITSKCLRHLNRGSHVQLLYHLQPPSSQTL